MEDKSELKSGWLTQDMDRAERRVSEWKIKKYTTADELDEDNQKQEQTEDQVLNTLNC